MVYIYIEIVGSPKEPTVNVLEDKKYERPLKNNLFCMSCQRDIVDILGPDHLKNAWPLIYSGFYTVNQFCMSNLYNPE